MTIRCSKLQTGLSIVLVLLIISACSGAPIYQLGDIAGRGFSKNGVKGILLRQAQEEIHDVTPWVGNNSTAGLNETSIEQPQPSDVVSSAEAEKDVISLPENISTDTPSEQIEPLEEVSDQDAAKVVPKLLGDKWRPQKPYPIGVSEAQGTILVHNGRSHMFVAGGYLHDSNYDVTNVTHSFTLFDDAPTEWVRRTDMPMPLTHVAQVGHGAKMYICGGFLGKHPGPSVRDCYMYDLAMDEWKKLPSLPHQRAGGGIVYIEKMHSLFFAGGVEREAGAVSGNDHDDSYMLDLNDWSKGWVQKAFFRNPRNHLSAVHVKDRYFFIGGQHQANEETGNQASLDEYVPDENKWYKRTDMPFGVGHLSASTPRWGGGFIVIGGVRNGKEKSDAVLFYDLLNDTWVDVGNYVYGVQTPVCGVVRNAIICTTGDGWKGEWDETYIRNIAHVTE